MSWRTTAGLLVVLLILGALVVIQSNGEPETPTPIPSSTPSIDLVRDVLEEAAQRLEVRRLEDDARVVFERNSDGEWAQVEPVARDVVTQTMVSRVTSIVNMTSRATLPAEANPLSAYGLDEPEFDFTLSALRDGKTVRFTFLVGNETPTGDGYYLLKSGDPRIHIGLKLTIENTTGLIDEPPIPEPTATAEATTEASGTPAAATATP